MIGLIKSFRIDLGKLPAQALNDLFEGLPLIRGDGFDDPAHSIFFDDHVSLLGGLPASCACWNAYFSLVSAAPGYPDTAVGLFHAQLENLKEYSDKKCNPNK